MISVISSFSDSTTGENTTTGCVNRLFVTFCDMSQKAIDTTGYGPRSCGVSAWMAILQQFAGALQDSWSKKKGGYPACDGRRRYVTEFRGLNRGRRHEWLAGGLCRQLSAATLSKDSPPCSCRSTGVRKAAGHAQNVLANILKERRRRSRLERCVRVAGRCV